MNTSRLEVSRQNLNDYCRSLAISLLGLAQETRQTVGLPSCKVVFGKVPKIRLTSSGKLKISLLDPLLLTDNVAIALDPHSTEIVHLNNINLRTISILVFGLAVNGRSNVPAHVRTAISSRKDIIPDRRLYHIALCRSNEFCNALASNLISSLCENAEGIINTVSEDSTLSYNLKQMILSIVANVKQSIDNGGKLNSVTCISSHLTWPIIIDTIVEESLMDWRQAEPPSAATPDIEGEQQHIEQQRSDGTDTWEFSRDMETAKRLMKGKLSITTETVKKLKHSKSKKPLAFDKLVRNLLRSMNEYRTLSSTKGDFVKDVTRAMTDGKIFAKRSLIPATNTAVALLLDCSGSTSGYIQKLGHFCSLLAKALLDNGAPCALWAFGTNVVPVPVHDYVIRKEIDCLGNTCTGSAVLAAKNWLSYIHGCNRKVVVLLTDGVPYVDGYYKSEDYSSHNTCSIARIKPRPETKKEIEKLKATSKYLRRSGVSILVGYYKQFIDQEAVVQFMPGAYLTPIDNNFETSCVRIAHRISQMQVLQ